ncbi:uncharacterized protein [Triticum aestivum]|uniref:uncharacterized protein isoform X1 n=1 Tax=Triticum aestivum TaxID=4565 RepID=UPI001D0144B5|nr:uncharacterized protein LOC123046285 isoform X1 [Triticum aestivum]
MPPTTSARKMLMFLDALCSTSGTVTAATRVRSTPPTEVVSRHGEVQRVAPLAVDCMAPTTCITSPLPADHPCCVAALLCSDAPPSGWRTRIQGCSKNKMHRFLFCMLFSSSTSDGQLPNNLVPLSACITKFKNQNSTSSTWCTTRRRSSRGHTVASWTTSSTRLPSSPTSSPSSSESSSSWGF